MLGAKGLRDSGPDQSAGSRLTGKPNAFLLTFAKMPIHERSGPILTEKPVSLPARKTPLALVALGSVPLLGVIAAFGIAPQTIPEPVAVERVVREVALFPSMSKPEGTDEVYWREERIQRGDTIAGLLARLQVNDRAAIEYLRTSHDVRLLRQLVPGRTVRATTGDDGSLRSLRYLGADGIELQVERNGDRFVSREQAPDGEVQLLMASGEINSSLFAATDAAGLSDPVAVQLAEIFSSDIDFHRDLRPGDRFSVVYESVFNRGEFVRTGRIVAAEFSTQGRTLRALYYSSRDGRGSYYTPEGRSMRRLFLRSPLEVSRVSSGFSTARFHPILQTWRAHKGVDYAAPVGTRVRATADGYVQFMGQYGGYGKVVVLRHGNGYTTLYGHLSGFARDTGVGRRVNQGDVVGYVGMTGLATGPHLHYEFRQNDVHQNPLKLAAPDALPLSPDARAKLLQTARPLLDRLDLIRGTRLTLAN